MGYGNGNTGTFTPMTPNYPQPSYPNGHAPNLPSGYGQGLLPSETGYTDGLVYPDFDQLGLNGQPANQAQTVSPADLLSTREGLGPYALSNQFMPQLPQVLGGPAPEAAPQVGHADGEADEFNWGKASFDWSGASFD